jgi:spore coat protein CotH
MRPSFRRLAAALLTAVAVAGLGLAAIGCGPDAATQTTGSPATSAPTATTKPAAVSGAAATQASGSLAGAKLFDSSKVHTVSVSFNQAEYEAMIAAYQSGNSKEWIKATVTIDGATFQNVGMRLKGNSSLRGLANGRGKGTGGLVSATEPQGLPWLIRLDKNVDGQNCDGITDLVIRSNNSSTSLNEAVALTLLQKAGLASERAIAVAFSANGSAAKLRLAVELPDDRWMAQHFSATGALYKAEATGDYGYHGADAKAYDNLFDQEAGKDDNDLTPLIKFLDFINNSDDATFNSTLAEKLDVDSFATYLAMEDLVANFDDMDGPGNNSYLYYDAAAGRFTIVPWDHNLAFAALGGGGGNLPAGNPGREAPGGNAGGRVPAGDPAGAGQGGNMPGGGGPKSRVNILVQRFHANGEFQALYQKRLSELKEQLYASGVAGDVLATWVNVLETQASGLVDAGTVETEAAKISTYFQAG